MGKKARKIISIDIELEDFEPIHLKMDEARELYEQLHDLFGDKQQDVQHHYYPWYQRPYYTWYNTSNMGTGNTFTSAAQTVESSSTLIGVDLASGPDMTVMSSQTGMKVHYKSIEPLT